MALETGKRYAFYAFLIRKIDGDCIISHSLAKLASIPQGQRLANTHKDTHVNTYTKYIDIPTPPATQPLTTHHHHPPPLTTHPHRICVCICSCVTQFVFVFFRIPSEVFFFTSPTFSSLPFPSPSLPLPHRSLTQPPSPWCRCAPNSESREKRYSILSYNYAGI